MTLYLHSDMLGNTALLYNHQTGAWVSFYHTNPTRKAIDVYFKTWSKVPRPAPDHPALLAVQLAPNARALKIPNSVDPDEFNGLYARLDEAYERAKTLREKPGKLADFESRSLHSHLLWAVRKTKARLEELVRMPIAEKKDARIIRTKRKPNYRLSLR